LVLAAKFSCNLPLPLAKSCGTIYLKLYKQLNTSPATSESICSTKTGVSPSIDDEESSAIFEAKNNQSPFREIMQQTVGSVVQKHMHG
jgi:hypothetical protein